MKIDERERERMLYYVWRGSQRVGNILCMIIIVSYISVSPPEDCEAQFEAVEWNEASVCWYPIYSNLNSETLIHLMDLTGIIFLSPIIEGQINILYEKTLSGKVLCSRSLQMCLKRVV